MKNIIGTKIGMTRVFDENDKLVPATVIKVDQCYIVDIKTIERNGYSAVSIGYSIKKANKANKPYSGIFKNISKIPLFIKEFKGTFDGGTIGQEIPVDIFAKGEYVDISSISKGKGFAGSMKRHNFRGLPESHGNGEYRRATGSIGASSYPSRVFKGQRMPGRLGGDNVTIQKLEIVDVNKEDSLILVKGSVPGINGSYVKIKETIKALKKKKAVVVSSSEVKLNRKR